MAEDDGPSWLVVGAEVVEYRLQNRRGEGAHVVATTVERLTKRDVVLANGARYNRGHLSKSNGAWSSNTYLIQATDPRVSRALAANGSARLWNQCRLAMDETSKRRDATSCLALIDALNDYLADMASAHTEKGNNDG